MIINYIDKLYESRGKIENKPVLYTETNKVLADTTYIFAIVIFEFASESEKIDMIIETILNMKLC